MPDNPVRDFKRAGCSGDDRVTVNLNYVISVAPDPTSAGLTVIRVTAGRGFEEYTLRGSYDEVRSALARTADGAVG